MSVAFTPVSVEPAPDEHLGEVWLDHCYRHPSRQPDCWWCMVPNPWITRFESHTTEELVERVQELTVPPPPEPITAMDYHYMLQLQEQFMLFGQVVTDVSDEMTVFSQWFRDYSNLLGEVEDEEGFCYWAGGLGAHRWEAARDKVPQV
jgi:hypothetical protein